MKNSPLIQTAIDFATFAHRHQQRKYTFQPYIDHPLAVAELVSTVHHTEEMIIAAILHDTVEDTEITFDEIKNIFGDEVVSLVENLTDVSNLSEGNRAFRKNKDLMHTAKASPFAKTIKLADLIDNTVSIMANDLNFGRTFLKEKAALLNVLKEGDSALYQKATELLIENQKIIAITFKST